MRERASLNKVILIGRLGRDPEVRYFPSGEGERAIARFSLATSEVYINRDGEKKEVTEWHSIYCWGKLAEFVRDYLRKGRQILVEGRLRTRKWETPEGQTRSKTEIEAEKIIPLDKRGASEEFSPVPDVGESEEPEEPIVPDIDDEEPPF